MRAGIIALCASWMIGCSLLVDLDYRFESDNTIDGGPESGIPMDAGPPDTGIVLSCDGRADGEPCGAPSCGAPFGTCVFEGDPSCDQTGTRTATCTPRICQAGSCVAGEPLVMAEPCSRDTAGRTCSATTCDAAGPCEGFADFCDATGTSSRTCTDFSCEGDVCVSAARMESEACSRPSREGMACASEQCGSCELASPLCAGNGTVTCTTFRCTSGSCAMQSTTRACTGPTGGLTCGAQPCPNGGSLDLCCDGVNPTCGAQCNPLQMCP